MERALVDLRSAIGVGGDLANYGHQVWWEGGR